MKNVVAVLVMLFALIALFPTPPVFAGEDQGPLNVVGAKLDAPDLVKFSEDVSLGVEISKQFYQYIKGSEWTHEDGDRGWSGIVKVTTKWSILDFSKKE